MHNFASAQTRIGTTSLSALQREAPSTAYPVVLHPSRTSEGGVAQVLDRLFRDNPCPKFGGLRLFLERLLCTLLDRNDRPPCGPLSQLRCWDSLLRRLLDKPGWDPPSRVGAQPRSARPCTDRLTHFPHPTFATLVLLLDFSAPPAQSARAGQTTVGHYWK